jgi:TonB-linked SusC/RagA family outer membrane protein
MKKHRLHALYVLGMALTSFSPNMVFGGKMANAETSINQQKEITGRVFDATGVPLSGVTVINLQTQASAQSNEDGSFSISAENGQRLRFSYQGFVSQELTIQDQSQVTIRLELDNTALDEVVVVGYGTQKKANLTGAVDQVGPEVFEGRPLANVSQMLQGAVPNLNIMPADGKPTRAPSFNIRGTTSIGQGGSALILIDGVEGDPSILNPNDIESVSVLKDASSAAIYGSRGTFGVVLITTKRAKEGRSTINYSGGLTSQSPTTLPDFVTDGYTYAERFFAAYNAWNNYSSIPSKLNKTQIFTVDWLEEFRKRKEAGNTETVTVNDNGEYVYYANEDYYGALLKDRTFVQDHNLSASGTSGKIDYFLSGRLFDNSGLYRYNTDTYKSYNTRAKAGLQVTDWLRVENNIDYSFVKYHDPSTAGEGGNIWRNIADEGHPSSPIYNPDGSFSFSAAYTLGDFIYGKNGTDFEKKDLRNTTSFATKFFNNTFRIKGDLTFRNRDYGSTRVRVPVPYSVKEGEIIPLKTGMNDNIYQVAQETNYLFTNLYGEYENTFAEDHYFKGLLGYNYEQQRYNSTYITKTGLLTTDVDNINLALGDAVQATAGYNRYRLAGLFFRLNYIYKDRYLFEANGRYDGSSKFPTNEQWAFFPSVSAGWRVSQEPFWEVSPEAISEFKIRASYGSLGNGNIAPYSFLDLYNINASGRVLDGRKNMYTSVPTVIPNNLTWETARTANLGVDLTFLNNKINFTGDIYRRETLNMYTAGQQLPEIFGATSPKGNYADMTTTGFEMTLSYRDRFQIGEKELGFGVKATLADYRSTIDRFNNETGNLNDYYAGKRYGEIWGYTTQGLFSSQEEIDGAPKQTLIKSSNSGKIYPGDIRFADLDGNGVIDYGSNTLDNHGDLSVIGNEEPRYIYGLNLNLDYSNVYFSAFFQGVGKQDWYPSNESIFWGQYNRPYNNLDRRQYGGIFSKIRRLQYFFKTNYPNTLSPKCSLYPVEKYSVGL